MLQFLRDRDKSEAFLAGAQPANSTDMKAKENKIQRDWEIVGGDRAHVQSE